MQYPYIEHGQNVPMPPVNIIDFVQRCQMKYSQNTLELGSPCPPIHLHVYVNLKEIATQALDSLGHSWI